MKIRLARRLCWIVHPLTIAMCIAIGIIGVKNNDIFIGVISILVVAALVLCLILEIMSVISFEDKIYLKLGKKKIFSWNYDEIEQVYLVNFSGVRDKSQWYVFVPKGVNEFRINYTECKKQFINFKVGDTRLRFKKTAHSAKVVSAYIKTEIKEVTIDPTTGIIPKQ